MTVATALASAEDKMDKALGVLKDELAGIRTGRATPALLRRVIVDYYGTPVPIQQLASFTVPEPRTLVITPYDRTRSRRRRRRSCRATSVSRRATTATSSG